MPSLPAPEPLPQETVTPEPIPEDLAGVDENIARLFPDIGYEILDKKAALDTEYEDLFDPQSTLTPEEKIEQQEEYDTGTANIADFEAAVVAYITSPDMTTAFNSIMSATVTAGILKNQPEMAGNSFSPDPATNLRPDTSAFVEMTIADLVTETGADAAAAIAAQSPTQKAQVATAQVNAGVSSFATRSMMTNNMDQVSSLPPDTLASVKKFGGAVSPTLPMPGKVGVGTQQIPKQMV